MNWIDTISQQLTEELRKIRKEEDPSTSTGTWDTVEDMPYVKVEYYPWQQGGYVPKRGEDITDADFKEIP